MPEAKELKQEDQLSRNEYFKIQTTSDHLPLDEVLKEVEEKTEDLFKLSEREDMVPAIFFRYGDCFVNWYVKHLLPKVKSFDFSAGENFTISHKEEKLFPVEVLQKGKEEFLKRGNGKYKHDPEIYLKKINHRTIKLFVI